MIVHNGLVLCGQSDKDFLTTWDFKTNTVNNYKAHNASIKCLSIHGNFLYTGSEDGIIKVWALNDDGMKQYVEKEPKEVILRAPSQPTETEEERQSKLTREIFNKIEALEDQMMVMSKSIQDLFGILKKLEGNMDKPKLTK